MWFFFVYFQVVCHCVCVCASLQLFFHGADGGFNQYQSVICSERTFSRGDVRVYSALCVQRDQLWPQGRPPRVYMLCVGGSGGVWRVVLVSFNKILQLKSRLVFHFVLHFSDTTNFMWPRCKTRHWSTPDTRHPTQSAVLSMQSGIQTVDPLIRVQLTLWLNNKN